MASNSASSALATTSAGPCTSLSLDLRSVDDLTRLAQVFAQSGLFSTGDPNTQIARCAVQLMAGMEAGMTPFASITSVYLVNGRPGFSAQAMAQAIKRHPDYDYRVVEKTDRVCKIRFLLRGEELGVETFTIEMAERANLIKGNGPWRQYPEAMLFARCLTAGMRTHCPDALGGHTPYTPEELGATGPINDDGMVTVTVTEQPQPSVVAVDRDLLLTQALSVIKKVGLTSDGVRTMLMELGGPDVTGLGQLDDTVLARLVKVGISSETVARWNVPEPEPEPEPELYDDDELPASWAMPSTALA